MTYEEVCDLFDSSPFSEPDDSVVLSNDEINRARRNKREARKKATGFQNTPIYRSLHASMRLIIEIVQLMPKKTVKVSDILLQNFTDMIRWTAAAYNHQDDFLKQNALEEAISLMSVIKITLNDPHILLPKARRSGGSAGGSAETGGPGGCPEGHPAHRHAVSALPDPYKRGYAVPGLGQGTHLLRFEWRRTLLAGDDRQHPGWNTGQL